VAGQGITVYEEWSAAQRNTYPLPGVCVDVERMSDERVAVACRGWVHVVEVNALGIATVLASARMHRRLDGSDASVHIASHVHVDGDTLYVSGWDHLDVYRLAETSTDPDIHVSAQRAHFGSPPGVAWFLVENAGQGTLEISEVTCTATGITCPIDATTIPPGGSATLRVVSDGSGDDVEALVGIVSNDPDDPEVPVIVLAALADAVDPLEEAPDFTGPTVLRDYDAGTFTDATLTLSEIDTAGEVAHFAIFGTWCPACMPVVVAMEPDVGDVLPTGARFFLVAQGEPDSVVEHVLEKIRIPVEVFLDGDESVGAGLYDQPRVGVPFGRAYVIDSDGFVTDVFAGYAPDDVNDAIDDAL